MGHARAVILCAAVGLALAAGPAAADPKLAADRGCTACHAVGKKLVGPDYVEVAKKYKGDATALDKLSASIVKGSQGKWGPIPMPPNAKVTPDEANTLAAWVLSR